MYVSKLHATIGSERILYQTVLHRPFLLEKTDKAEKGGKMLESKYFDEQLFKNCLVKLSKFEEENLRFSNSDICSHFRKPQVRPPLWEPMRLGRMGRAPWSIGRVLDS